MSKVGEIVVAKRLVLGMSQEELAQAVGVKQQRIADIESGRVVVPRYWERLAAALKIDREDFRRTIIEASADHQRRLLSLGNRQQSQRTDAPATNAVTAVRVPYLTSMRIPVLGHAVGGTNGEYIFNGDVIDYVMCPPELDNVHGAYAVFVDGDSMAPRYRSGETVWVHPYRPPRRGDDVVVQILVEPNNPPHGYIKEFVGWTGNTLKLRQHNPAREISFERDNVASVHLIVFSQKA